MGGVNSIDAALSDALAGGPVPAAEVKALLQALGFTDKQIRGARERLGVVAERTGFGAALVSAWSLPGQFYPAVSFVPFADSAVLPTGDQFGPEEVTRLRAEIERLERALAAAQPKSRTPKPIDDTDRVLLSMVPRAWSSVLAITSQRVAKLQNGLSVQRRLERLAEAGLVESRPGGKMTRHGSLVPVYRLAMTGRAAGAPADRR